MSIVESSAVLVVILVVVRWGLGVCGVSCSLFLCFCFRISAFGFYVDW